MEPPAFRSVMIKPLKVTTVEQREQALRDTEYNVFSFPADMLAVDLLSDSGVTTMNHLQWSAMFHGDEFYGRNTGYYLLLDAVRDTFERGDNPEEIYKHVLSGESSVETLMEDVYLKRYEGGFVNGGPAQLNRPNAFIVPQARCAEFLLFSTLAEVLQETNPLGSWIIPNNGHFDTTEANVLASGFEAINLFSADPLAPFDGGQMLTENPFRGNMSTSRLEDLIQTRGASSIPIIFLTITNNTCAGQPVSMQNIRDVSEIAARFNIPLFFDACRFAENAWFIKKYETGYSNVSIRGIIREMFSYVDGFSISFKKDGMANIGGGLFFKDCGTFQQTYPGIGILLKEKQIRIFGNDSYGGLSGRDLMTITLGLTQVVCNDYLTQRIRQVQKFAEKLDDAGVPIVLPVGGHAIYIDIDRFFEGNNRSLEEFPGNSDH